MTWDILKQRKIEKLETEHEQLTDDLKSAISNEDIENIVSEIEEIEIDLKNLQGKK